MPQTHDQESAIIVLMGATGTGKTMFINHASGAGFSIGNQLESCTTEVQATPPFLVDGKSVILVDTPGFDDTDRSDTDILHTIVDYLTTSYKGGQKLAGVLYFHRISDSRMGGISRRNFELFRQLCGEGTLKNVIIVTNMWDKVTEPEGAGRESELKTNNKYFAPAIQAGAQMTRHHENPESATTILRLIIDNIPLPLKIQKEVVEDGLEIRETAAGQVLFKALLAKHAQQQKELAELLREVMRASEKGREELRLQLKERDTEIKKLQAELARICPNPASQHHPQVSAQTRNQLSTVLRTASTFSTLAELAFPKTLETVDHNPAIRRHPQVSAQTRIQLSTILRAASTFSTLAELAFPKTLEIIHHNPAIQSHPRVSAQTDGHLSTIP